MTMMTRKIQNYVGKRDDKARKNDADDKKKLQRSTYLDIQRCRDP